MILVTLDDIGLSTEVNAAAESCVEYCTVGCLSLLATGPALNGALEIACRSDLQISVHLNCLEPPFLTDAAFPGSPAGWMLRGKSLTAVVTSEWRAQIELVLSSGAMITRLDSHRHTHMLPGLRGIILDLAEEYGVGSVRTAILPDRLRRPSGLVLDRLGRSFGRAASARGVRTPAAMLGFSRSGNVTREYLQRYTDLISGDGETELVMHPAGVPVWSEGQPGELSLLTSHWFRDWISS